MSLTNVSSKIAGRRQTQDLCNAVTVLSMMASASREPSASPFSKSPPSVPIVLVTCARQRTRTFAAREGVERRSLHLDGENPFGARRRDSLGRFAERGVGRPARTHDAAMVQRRQGFGRRRHQFRVRFGKLGGRRVVVARSLIAQAAIDDDEVGRRPCRGNLPCGSQGHQQTATAGEQFLCDKDREGRADDAAHNSDLMRAQRERVEVGVVAGPALKGLRLTRLP